MGFVLIQRLAADAEGIEIGFDALANRCAITLQRNQQLRIVGLRVAGPVTLDAVVDANVQRAGQGGVGR